MAAQRSEALSHPCRICGAKKGEQCRTGGSTVLKPDPKREAGGGRAGPNVYPVGEEHGSRGA